MLTMKHYSQTIYVNVNNKLFVSSSWVIIHKTTLSAKYPPEYVSSVAELDLHISATVRKQLKQIMIQLLH
jgi:predicted secreted protein